MSVERLKSIKNQLLSCTEGQMSDLKNVHTKELGEVIDMIKDLEEAIYYCTITKAMNKEEEKDQESVNNYYYSTNYPIPRYYHPEIYRRIDRDNGHMYYEDNDEMLRDPREGKSSLRRKSYMEGKEVKRDKQQQMKELEAYVQELSTDITEMIRDASPEERAILHQKMTTLASKLT